MSRPLYVDLSAVYESFNVDNVVWMVAEWIKRHDSYKPKRIYRRYVQEVARNRTRKRSLGLVGTNCRTVATQYLSESNPIFGHRHRHSFGRGGEW
jgi:hypothetical protein